ncbi:MAG: hypothetical protein KDB71_17680 [Mycobacterium sp.]|nr:hypothetical protein [Mycobacterium sp.]
MWCPSVSLSVWANAWLAGRAAPDDVLDALSDWAPKHSVLAYDAVAAGRTGLPWPDVDAAGPMSLLQTVRTAVGARPAAGYADQAWPAVPTIAVLLPAPGDVRGLAPGSQFAVDALAAGEAVVVGAPDGQTVGVVPAFECEDRDGAQDDAAGDPVVLSWSVYSLPGSPALDHLDLGEAEYALRSAVRSAADALTSLQLSGTSGDPRSLVDEVLQANQHHRVPDHAPTRAIRVLSTAAHVDAIITVSSGLTTIGTQSASEARIADAALRPLASVVRAARSAAVSAILKSAWQS